MRWAAVHPPPHWRRRVSFPIKLTVLQEVKTTIFSIKSIGIINEIPSIDQRYNTSGRLRVRLSHHVLGASTDAADPHAQLLQAQPSAATAGLLLRGPGRQRLQSGREAVSESAQRLAADPGPGARAGRGAVRAARPQNHAHA